MYSTIRSALLLLFALPAIALAQANPAKPIRMIVPVPSDSLLDILGRSIGQTLSPGWGQPIIVDNRSGVNGTIGMEACFKSPGDCYTICIPGGNIMPLNPHAYARLPYDPYEFAPVKGVRPLAIYFQI